MKDAFAGFPNIDHSYTYVLVCTAAFVQQRLYSSMLSTFVSLSLSVSLSPLSLSHGNPKNVSGSLFIPDLTKLCRPCHKGHEIVPCVGQ